MRLIVWTHSSSDWHGQWSDYLVREADTGRDADKNSREAGVEGECMEQMANKRGESERERN